MIAEIVLGIIISLLLLGLSVLLVRILLKIWIRKRISNVSMIGKVVIVTGANSGIGFDTAKDLAVRGSRVILACRNKDRGLLARDKISKLTGNDNIIIKQLDLSSLDSVRQFAEDINRTENRLDVLVNNAGIYGLGSVQTVDGNVENLQTNYFGPFLLTLLLLPLLKKSQPSRIVNVSSIMHYFAWFDLERINKVGYYSDFRTYCNSKLCLVLFTVKLAKYLKDTSVVVNAVHPGVIQTHINENMATIPGLIFKFACWICSCTVEEGAQTVVHVCVAEECANISGKYFSDCRQRFMSWKAQNNLLVDGLWAMSEKVVGYRYEENCIPDLQQK